MKNTKKPVLAYGEVTGHMHVLVSGTDVWEDETGVKKFTIEQPDTVRHEEHKPVELPAGEYLSDTVLERDHFADETRRVQD